MLELFAFLLEKSFKEGEPLEHPLLNRSIGTAQKRVEGQNYSQRKRLLQYDDVLNYQRQIIYGLRNKTLTETNTRKNILEVIAEEIEERVALIYPDSDRMADREGA
jgi:preprotein translocase subunit SecA